MAEEKDTSTERVTASGLVSDEPCFLYSIAGIGIGDTTNVYTIYDGHNTSGEAKMRLVAGSYAADFRLFSIPIFFTRGIYVDFTTNGSEVVAQILQLAHM